MAGRFGSAPNLLVLETSVQLLTLTTYMYYLACIPEIESRTEASQTSVISSFTIRTYFKI